MPGTEGHVVANTVAAVVSRFSAAPRHMIGIVGLCVEYVWAIAKDSCKADTEGSGSDSTLVVSGVI